MFLPLMYSPATERHRIEFMPETSTVVSVFRKGLKPLLKGPLLKAWVRRASTALTRDYSAMLLKSASGPHPTTPVGPLKLRQNSLRKLLFICDNMWERRELLPELQKICETSFIDVHARKRSAARVADERLPLAGIREELDLHRATEFDLVIVYLNSALLSPELLEYLRRSWSCPLLGMNLDDKTTFFDSDAFRSSARNYRRWARDFDCNLSNSRCMVDVYRDQGFPCVYIPTGFHFNRELHSAETTEPYQRLLAFVGSMKPEREELIGELARRGLHVELFGSGWQNAKFTDEGWRIYRTTQLNLGIGFNIPGGQFTNLKNRDFECPGAGGCYITTYDWELAELFHVGREILCYRNVEEFVELYSYYSRRPEACRKIAMAGAIRARKEHTWEQRFRQVFSELGFRFA